MAAAEGLSPREALRGDEWVRHRRVPERDFGDKVIVARPTDGTPVVLAATATVLWRHIADWTTVDKVVDVLGDVYSAVDEAERRRAASQIIFRLEEDGLVERG
jgi:hypothetical protein